MFKLPDDPTQILSAMAALLKRGKGAHLIEVLEASEPTMESSEDCWGDKSYRLVLSLPIDLFASLDGQYDECERLLGTVAETATRGCTDAQLRQVLLSPNLDSPDNWRSGARPLSVSAGDADRLWRPGYFRLFVSHESSHKKELTLLRESMDRRFISAFVAHEDIEPCREWQDEIRSALASCHAMLAFVTPGFHDSVWCMQEVGWALGRGILVIPVMAPSEPKGFLGIPQALRITGSKSWELRDRIVDVLWKSDRTQRQLTESLVLGVERAPSIEAARACVHMIVTSRSLSEVHAKRLLAATTTNAHVMADRDLVLMLEEKAASVGVKSSSQQTDESQYDPFADE